MPFVSKTKPLASLDFLATSSQFSLLPQMGTRLSKVKLISLSSTANKSKVQVKSPLSSSFILIPRPEPSVTPYGKSFKMASKASLSSALREGSFTAKDKAARPAFFPRCGVEACALTPITVTVLPDLSKRTPHSFSTASFACLNSSSDKVLNSITAFCGTALTATPAFKERRDPLAVLFFFKVPLMAPFSILIIGNSASGVKLISPAFSFL